MKWVIAFIMMFIFVSASAVDVDNTKYKYAREFLSQFKKQADYKELKEILYKWQIEWEKKYWKNSTSDFYELVWYIKKWEKNIETFIFDTLQEDVPNFYKSISSKKYSIFSKEFYNVIKNKEKVKLIREITKELKKGI